MAQEMGLKVRNMYLCVFYPGKTWQKIPVPVMDDERMWLLNHMNEQLREQLRDVG
jgi:hypothetical protein